jgi:hypothetical protein
MKPERASQRALFLTRVGELRKGWQDVPTRQLLRSRKVPSELMVETRLSISEMISKVRSEL